jgi:hypothetical protein
MNSARIVREDSSGIYLSHTPMVGLVFVAVGGAMAYFGFFRLADDTIGRWMLGGMGIFFAVMGVLAMLWRYELKLDLMTRTYRGRRGFWPSPKVLQGSLDELRGIAIEQMWRKSSSSNGESSEHPSWVLSFDFGDWSVRFFESRREEMAFAKLEQLARLMQVHVLDRTGDTEMRRAWNELDRSVAESLQSADEKPADPGSPPPDSKTLCAIIVFGLMFAGFGIAVLLSLTGVWDVPYSGSRVVGWVLGTVFCLIGLFLMFGAVWGSYAREVVREERDGLIFCLVLLGKRYRQRFIPKREIEEVALKPIATARMHRLQKKKRATATPRGKGKHEVVVRSDDELVKIGGDLEPDDQDWLLRALTYLATR